MRSFPLFLDLAGRRIVIVGGGEQAAQKLRLALKTDAAIDVVAETPCTEIAAWIGRGRVRQHRPGALADVLRGAALAFVATGEPDSDTAAAGLARAAGVLVNVVDRPELCDVTTPAIVDRDPVVVAIGTEGTAPVLARQIKTRIEEMLEPSLGEVAALAGQLRAEVAAHVPHQRRRRFWEWFFTGPRRLLAAGRGDAARAAIAQALATGQAPDAHGGLVSIVGAGPGASDMLTLRGVQRLQTADVILHDERLASGLLELARRDAERIPVPPHWTVARISEAVAEAAGQGRRVVRLIAGDAGHAAAETAALDAAGVDWELVAGVAAPAAPTGASAVVPFPEQRRAHANNRRAERHGALEIAAHSH